MMTHEEIAGRWKELRGKIEKRWSQLSGNDLEGVDGDVDMLVGTIQRKTGQVRSAIEDELEKLMAELSDASEAGADYAKQAAQYAGKAGEAVREQYEHVEQAVLDGKAHVEDTIRRRPAESVAVAFGTGLIAGVVCGLVFRR